MENYPESDLHDLIIHINNDLEIHSLQTDLTLIFTIIHFLLLLRSVIIKPTKLWKIFNLLINKFGGTAL